MKADAGARRVLMMAVGVLITIHPSAAQGIYCPDVYRLDGVTLSWSQDSLTMPTPVGIPLLVTGADKMQFKLDQIQTANSEGTNCLVVSPSSGVAPTYVGVGLNPDVAPYTSKCWSAAVQLITVGQTPPSRALFLVKLNKQYVSAPAITAVVSAATFQPTVSPGQVVSIFGSSIGTPPLSARYDANGLYSSTLGETNVTFNGAAAPLLFVSTTQINAVVPFGVAGQRTADVVVTHYGRESPPFSVSVVDTAPGIFTATQTGRGQGAILNVNMNNPNILTPNSVDNPVPKGSAIVIYATGAGLWNRTVPDGALLLAVVQPPILPVAPVSLTIGGQPAYLLWAGASPYQVAGMLQVNALVPSNIGSGPQPLVLTVGQTNNEQQQVTVAVQ